MTYWLGGLLIGAALGIGRARSIGGNRLDMAQWGAVFAIIGGLVGLALLIALRRAGA